MTAVAGEWLSNWARVRRVLEKVAAEGGRRRVGILTVGSRGRVKEEMTAHFGGVWWNRLRASRRLSWRSF